MQHQGQSENHYESQVERENMQPPMSGQPWQPQASQPQAWMPQMQAQPWNAGMQQPFQQPIPQAVPPGQIAGQMAQPQATMMQPPPFYAPQVPAGMAVPRPGIPQVWEPGMLPMEMSYIENILRLNRGKPVKVYMTYENNPQWPAVTYTGIVEEAGRDHIVLSDPQTGKWYLLLMVNLDYIVFDEQIEYDYPYGAAPVSAYPPR